uniref:RING-type domain-containing protein n=1 Tax=Tetradesmus obliquus TaxID=3088 RepID=A0A383WEU8_TETOB|eukprot:jgi/Sobl393_1/12223/SZX76138.1
MQDHACCRNCLEASCPICLSGPLSDSQSPAHKLPCGHMAHYSCIQATDKPLASICTACNGSSSSSSAAAGQEASRLAASRLPPAVAKLASFGSSSSSRAATKERFFAGFAAAEFAAARNPTPAGGSSSSSSSSRAAAKERFFAGLAAEVAAARNPVPAGGSSSSSSSSRVSGYVRDLLDLLQPESAMNLGEGELLPLLQELEGQALLPAREVRFFTEEASPADDNITLCSHPRKFRQLLEAAIRLVLLTVPETEAKGAAINAVVQLLLRSTSGSSSMLQLQGKPVSIDRIEVAGSVGKSVAVQGQWDVDLVAFVNVPETSDIIRSIDLLDPEITHNSWWMADLQQQLCCLLHQQLQAGSGSSSCSVLQVTEPPRIGRAAVTFTAAVLLDEREHALNFDVLLAPNFAAGAGAAAAAAAAAKLKAGGGSSSSSSSSMPSSQPPADVQRRAVLAPVLAVADIAATQFVQQAAVAAAAEGLSGRVVTSTIRLVKAWVRKGLQQQQGMGGFKRLRSFQIELLVLHAAERLAGGSSTTAAAAAAAAAATAAAAAAAAAATAAAAAAGRLGQPVLFVDLAGGRYYSKQQAEALRVFGITSRDARGSGQPLVVHPVDPTCSVFDQTEAPFQLWAEFGRAAQRLQQQLLTCSWGEIARNSSLSAVVA